MFHSLRKAAVLFPLLSIGAAPVMAQSFTTPVADEYVYGSTADIIKPKVTANYSRGNFPSGFGNTDLYLSSWSTNDQTSVSEFIYTFTSPSIPTAIMSQGSFFYKYVADLEVGIVNDGSGGHQILVAYYDYLGSHSPTGNAGHMLDIYKLTGNPSAPLGLANQIQLSYSPKYGRISMDSHKDYAVAIAWDYPGKGIQASVCDLGNWSGVTTLAGTGKQKGPDVAFSHSSSNLNVHFVYKSTSAITESMLDWPLLLSVPFGSSVSMAPSIEDVDAVPFKTSNLVLDCPDHYDVENWAYTYTDGKYVYVRHIDFHSTATPMTTVVNDGVNFSNYPLAKKYYADAPTLHYGDGAISGGTTGQISVGWNNRVHDGSISNYVGLEMKEDGGTMLSLPDYMELPNSALPYSSGYTGIAYSKMSDGAGGLAPEFMYATYFTEVSPGSGYYKLHHAFHKWNDVVFKGANDMKHDVNCKSPSRKEQADLLVTTTSPNPFQSKFRHNLTLNEAADIQLTLVNVTGRVVAQKTEKLGRGNHTMEMSGLDNVPAGNYILTTNLNGKTVGAKVMVKQ
ncbi:MAG: T9SS type A sorting domain-containing protein [Sphingobacteriales bacterium]|nr:MAG: T9SS type A sorting domain-containing protein [Sphingobacteriales bacterium]